MRRRRRWGTRRLRPERALLQLVQRAAKIRRHGPDHMRVDHRRLHTLVAQQVLRGQAMSKTSPWFRST